MESLFGYNPDDKKPGDRRGRAVDGSQPQYIQIIDPKKAQNLSILLKALNVSTEEVRDALLEGLSLSVSHTHAHILTHSLKDTLGCTNSLTCAYARAYNFEKYVSNVHEHRSVEQVLA